MLSGEILNKRERKIARQGNQPRRLGERRREGGRGGERGRTVFAMRCPKENNPSLARNPSGKKGIQQTARGIFRPENGKQETWRLRPQR